MTSEKNLGSETRHNVEWLASQLQEFLERLRGQGYSSGTFNNYCQTARLFQDEVKQRGLDVEDLDVPTIESLQEAVLSKKTAKNRTFAMFQLSRFIDHLVDTGVLTRPIPSVKVPTAMDSLREEYDAYLRIQRGLSGATIYHCMSFLERFMDFRFGKTLGDLNTISSDDIVTFFNLVKGSASPLPSQVGTFTIAESVQVSFLEWQPAAPFDQ